MPPRKKEYTPEEKAEIVRRLREGKERARLAREKKNQTNNETKNEPKNEPKKIEKVKLPDPPLDVKIPDLKEEAKQEIAKPKRAPKTAKFPKEEEQKIEVVNTPLPTPPPPPLPEEDSDEEEGEYVPLNLPNSKEEPPPSPPKLQRNQKVITQPSAEQAEPQFRPPRRRPQLPPELLKAKQQQAQIQQRKLTTLDIAYSSLF